MSSEEYDGAEEGGGRSGGLIGNAVREARMKDLKEKRFTVVF